jgi:hypothetical protein
MVHRCLEIVQQIWAVEQVGNFDETPTAEVVRTLQHLIDIVNAAPDGGQLALGDVADHFKAAGLEGEDLLEILLPDLFQEAEVTRVVIVVGIHFWEVVWHDLPHHIGDNRVILPCTVFAGKEAHHLEPVTTCPTHQLCWRRGLRRDDRDDPCMVVHRQMKGQGLPVHARPRQTPESLEDGDPARI